MFSQQQTVLTAICLWKEQRRKGRAGLQSDGRKEKADRTGQMGRERGGEKERTRTNLMKTLGHTRRRGADSSAETQTKTLRWMELI